MRTNAGLLLLAGVLTCTSALADVLANSSYWTGARTTPDNEGVHGISQWDGTTGAESQTDTGFRLAWNITQSGNLFTYQYTITGATQDTSGNYNPLAKGLSHFLLQVTPGFTQTNGSGFTYDAPKTYDSTSNGNANPTIPAGKSIFAATFTPTSADATTWTFSFTSPNRPVWGDFYAIDGKNTTPETSAYNTGFGVDPGCVSTASCGALASITGLDLANYEAWIVRPDGVVPEPGFYGALAAGLSGLYVFVRRRRTA